MSKAIFFNIPASGHLNPSLPLTAELVRRGEQLIHFNTEKYRPLIEATGATFRPYTHIGDDYFGIPPMDGSNPPLAATRIITTTRDALPDLIEAVRAEQPDYLLYELNVSMGRIGGAHPQTTVRDFAGALDRNAQCDGDPRRTAHVGIGDHALAAARAPFQPDFGRNWQAVRHQAADSAGSIQRACRHDDLLHVCRIAARF